ncbi:MAG: serine/threonine-protein kinase, partial [Myxococcota bacterium]
MASDTTRTSTIKRLRSSASNRLTEALLSSSGKVAGVGLASAMITLGFAIWFGVELRHQSEIGAPLARSAAVLNASLNQSLASLRGWVAYGDAESRAERSRIWSDQIEPTLERIKMLAGESAMLDAEDKVATLESRLRELKLVQWAIEDVAQTPGNQPAAVAYEKRLETLRQSILVSLRDAIEQYTSDDQPEPRIEFLAELARFRSSFTEGDLALGSLIRRYDEAREHTAKWRLSKSRMIAKEIKAGAPLHTSGDLRRLVDFAMREFIAYDLQVQEVIALRRSAASNVAQLLYIQEAQPLVIEVRATASALAEAQALALENDTELLTRASYLVILMALTMGLLSGGSLFVSYRLQQQVHNVMDRAKRLGQYEIEERIGKGGMGEVYLARHAMLRRPTAIKLLRAESAQDLRAQNRFQREVQLTCQLTHPNTIEIFDYGRTREGIFYYAMEYLDGFTIEALVSLSGPVEPARVIHTLVQACGALQEAHDRGLLHRDLKPSNIMLTTQGGVFDTVKILDFGLVKDLGADDVDEVGGRDVILGTP